jgi:hypothetical protein
MTSDNPLRGLGLATGLLYRLRLIGRDSTEAYVTSGVINGEIQGRSFGSGLRRGLPAGRGTALIHSHWAVLAEPESDSFEGDLRGRL